MAVLFSYNSGFPFTVSSGFGSRTTGSNTGSGKDRANQVGDPFSGVAQPQQTGGLLTKGVRWMNPGAFTVNAPGTFGTSKRNQFYGPPFKTIDFSVFKNTSITERLSTQLRIEMFNIFNILNLAGPDSCVCSGGGFGLIGSTYGTAIGAPGIGPGEPFNVQVALKFIW